MKAPQRNPFDVTRDNDRFQIWEIIVQQDIDCFVKQDWENYSRSFDSNGFFGIDACGSSDPFDWKYAFPTLETYRQLWLEEASDSRSLYAEPLNDALHQIVHVNRIDVQNDAAVAFKVFDGRLIRRDAEADVVRWLSVYFLSRVAGQWLIKGFVGYLPHGTESMRLPHFEDTLEGCK